VLLGRLALPATDEVSCCALRRCGGQAATSAPPGPGAAGSGGPGLGSGSVGGGAGGGGLAGAWRYELLLGDHAPSLQLLDVSLVDAPLQPELQRGPGAVGGDGAWQAAVPVPGSGPGGGSGGAGLWLCVRLVAKAALAAPRGLGSACASIGGPTSPPLAESVVFVEATSADLQSANADAAAAASAGSGRRGTVCLVGLRTGALAAFATEEVAGCSDGNVPSGAVGAASGVVGEALRPMRLRQLWCTPVRLRLPCASAKACERARPCSALAVQLLRVALHCGMTGPG
jgi:hypothetical protein